ncbi:hypothetical protein HZH68_007687 [Vespula germanica]|uniref:Uncharacterized protein n=1 Tax=Vespula germanica TaxID=30212 RepID=A0A834N7Y5_VESGE|nr:hypothetical protein HZH68_007687 [Vespula germanica]
MRRRLTTCTKCRLNALMATSQSSPKCGDRGGMKCHCMPSSLRNCFPFQIPLLTPKVPLARDYKSDRDSLPPSRIKSFGSTKGRNFDSVPLGFTVPSVNCLN